MYKPVKVGEYIPDLAILDQVIVDTKAVGRIGDHEIGQMVNYVKVTGLELGLMFNLKKVNWRVNAWY